MNPSLGWLQAFLCVAEHLDYERAATDLGINARRVRARVEKLEHWFSKILVFDDPTALHEGDGEEFIPIARDILQRFDAACSDSEEGASPVSETRRAKIISKIDLADFERLISVADEGSYKGAAGALNCDVSTIQRSIRSLEKVVGRKIFSGRYSLNLTSDGQKLKEAAAFIVDSLTRFRADKPSEYERALRKVSDIRDLLKIRQAKLLFYSAMIEASGKTHRGKVQLADVQHSLQEITKRIDQIEAEFGPYPSRSGEKIDVSGITPLPKLKPGKD